MNEQTFDFALTLRCYRKSLGLDQDELAELLDVTQATVSRWEAGIRTPRDPVEVLMRLHELNDAFDDVVDDVTELAMRDDAGHMADLTEAITHTPDQPTPSEPKLTQAEDQLLARAGLNRTHLWTSISKPLDTHNIPQ